jgi:hypothetical protein
VSERVGSINTYLGLSKEEVSSARPSSSMVQNRLLLLGILSGNTNGVPVQSLQSMVANTVPPDSLLDLVSDLRKRELIEVETLQDPLNPVVKITQKGQEQLSLLS